MATTKQDTEITLGTGRMLLLFFTLVLVCAVFFSIGFSLGRKTAVVGIANAMSASPQNPAAVVRPSAAKENAPTPAAQPTDFSFYKSVGAATANTELAPQNPQTQPATATPSQPPPSAAPALTATTVAPTNASYTFGNYFVQVAAVTRQEDADSLVEALKKKQYPAFAINSSADKFYHVQIGPYVDLKDAEAMRNRLIADGYNPILKK